MSGIPSFQGTESFFAGGQKPAPSDGLITEVAGVLGRALGQALSPGSSFVNPLTGVGADQLSVERQRLDMAIRQSREVGEELARADSRRMTNFLASVFGAVTGDGATAEQRALAERLSTPAANFVTSPLAEALLPRGLREFLVPTIDVPRQAADLLGRADPTDSIGASDVSRAAIGLVNGIGGGFDPAISQGFSVSQLGAITQVLQKQGMLGFDPGGTSEQIATGIGDSLRGVTQALGIARDSLGASTPSEAFSAVQAVTGGALGQMSPTEVSQQLEVLKRVSESAQVAADVLVDFVDQSVALARRQGLGSTGAARAALESIQAGQLGAATIGNALGGEPAPGVGLSADVLQASYQERAFAAQASPLAARAAVALRDLSSVAESRGVALEDLGGGPTVESLLRLQSGDATAADLRQLSASNLASAVAGFTGEDAGQVASRFNNMALSQRAMQAFPELVGGVQALQPIEAAARYQGEASRIAGMSLSTTDAATALSAAVFSGGDPSRFRAFAQAQGLEGVSDLSVGEVLSLEQLGLRAGITPEQAVLNFSSDELRNVTRYTRGAASAAVSLDSRGRLSPFDAAVSRFEDFGVAGLLGAVPTSDVTRGFANTPGAVESLLNASDSSRDGMINALANAVDPAGRMGFADSLRGMIDDGASVAEVRSAISQTEPDIAGQVAAAVRDGVLQAAQIISGGDVPISRAN